MGVPLNVLIIEDLEEDTLLIYNELKRGGYDVVYERVDTEEGFKSAIDKRKWDVIIADYSMPHFSGLEALRLLKEQELDIPFFIVSGAISEDMAVSAMRAGAHDYVMKGNLKRLVPAVQRELRDAETRMERRKAEEAIREYKIEKEMAKKIFQKLLPQKLPEIDGVKISLEFQPSEDFSGDFYDVVQLSDNKLAIFVADVVGHGLSAAFTVSNLKSAMTLLLQNSDIQQQQSLLPLVNTPGKFLEKMNRMLVPIFGDDMFATALFVLLDTEKMTLKYASAGHPNPIIIKSSMQGPVLQESRQSLVKGFPLGSIQSATYKDIELKIESESKILLYTDGIVEAQNKDKEEFGVKRLYESFIKGIGENCKSNIIVKCIIDEVSDFTGSKSFIDDVLLLVIDLNFETKNKCHRSWIIPSNLKMVKEIVKDVEHTLISNGWNEDLVSSIKISVDEAIFNAIIHGNKKDESKKVFIELRGCKKDGEKVVITVQDEGNGFDYNNLPDPRMPENLLRDDGGRGVFIMRHFMDKVSFNEIGNKVEMIKYKR